VWKFPFILAMFFIYQGDVPRLESESFSSSENSQNSYYFTTHHAN